MGCFGVEALENTAVMDRLEPLNLGWLSVDHFV